MHPTTELTLFIIQGAAFLAATATRFFFVGTYKAFLASDVTKEGRAIDRRHLTISYAACALFLAAGTATATTLAFFCSGVFGKLQVVLVLVGAALLARTAYLGGKAQGDSYEIDV